MPETPPHTAERPATALRHLILGTAGHIDHGKTALVKALTGVDADRLPEEQARGMTIELGFADLDLGPVHLGVVDVPGHEKFVRTMVAGATGIDLVMLVVAADDSVMPQTQEHVDILQLLGVRHGLVAISKCDLVDDEMAELVSEEVGLLLESTPMAGFPVVRVSAHSGAGLDALREALRGQAQAVPARRESSIFRLGIDRVFTVHGRGTVVTGSATSGQVSVGTALELLPRGLPCKVRDLQSHHDHAEALGLGQRVALNLAGLDKDQLSRGDELATPGYLTPAQRIDVHLHALSSNPRPLRQNLTVRLCLGTAEYRARLRLLEDRTLDPGQSAFAQLLSTSPLAAAWGQRYILRDDTNARTLGGGTVARPVTRRLRSGENADLAGLRTLLGGDLPQRLGEVLRFEALPAASDLQLACQSGADPGAIPALLEDLLAAGELLRLGPRGAWLSCARLADCRQRTLQWLQRFHRRNPDEPGCPRDTLQGWLKRKWGPALAEHLFKSLCDDQLKILGRYCCLREFAPKMSADEEQLLERLVGEIGQSAFQPPAVPALSAARSVQPARLKKLIKIAVASGQLVQISPDILLHHEPFERLKALLAEHIEQHGGLTVSEVRTMIDSSRKFVVPILEYLDRVGYTKRVGDQRVLDQG